MAEEKAHGLDNGHEGKDHAHGAGGAVAFQHAHKKGVGHVVKRRDQHADDTGEGQAANQPADRGLGHLVKFLFLLFVHMVVHSGSAFLCPFVIF